MDHLYRAWSGLDRKDGPMTWGTFPLCHVQVMPPALLWGAGTAIGEIPPYAFSYHAAKAGIRNEEWDNMFQVTPVSEGQGLIEALVNRMKNWMLRFIQKCALRQPHDLLGFLNLMPPVSADSNGCHLHWVEDSADAPLGGGHGTP